MGDDTVSGSFSGCCWCFGGGGFCLSVESFMFRVGAPGFESGELYRSFVLETQKQRLEG